MKSLGRLRITQKTSYPVCAADCCIGLLLSLVLTNRPVLAGEYHRQWVYVVLAEDLCNILATCPYKRARRRVALQMLFNRCDQPQSGGEILLRTWTNLFLGGFTTVCPLLCRCLGIFWALLLAVAIFHSFTLNVWPPAGVKSPVHLIRSSAHYWSHWNSGLTIQPLLWWPFTVCHTCYSSLNYLASPDCNHFTFKVVHFWLPVCLVRLAFGLCMPPFGFNRLLFFLGQCSTHWTPKLLATLDPPSFPLRMPVGAIVNIWTNYCYTGHNHLYFTTPPLFTTLSSILLHSTVLHWMPLEILPIM